MLCTETGVIEGSDYYFVTPSPTAKSLFYYLLSAGSFTCKNGYRVKREKSDSVLLMLILDGECTVQAEGRTAVARRGDIALLNCYKPHEYYCGDTLKMLWLHFDGGQSTSFADKIIKEQGLAFRCENQTLFRRALGGILEALRKEQTLSETSVSCILHSLLCNLISSTSPGGTLELEDATIQSAVEYIKASFASELTVGGIARRVSMSQSHLSRVFKRQTGCAPYEYIIKTRLDAAKAMLKATALPLEQIAAKTGFGSAANFVYTFHAHVGISPGRFRKMPF